jgi:hypothetical protein
MVFLDHSTLTSRWGMKSATPTIDGNPLPADQFDFDGDGGLLVPVNGGK